MHPLKFDKTNGPQSELNTLEINTETIWKEFGNDLYLFVQSRVKNKSVSQDILQDVFIKIHLNLNNLKNPSKLVPWIYQIARNTIQNHYRSERTFLDAENLELPVPENKDQNEDFIRCMSSFIQHLPEKYKQALVLTDLRNLNQRALSKQLNISYSGAKSRVQRARQLLRSYFESCCNILSDKYGNIVSHQPRGNCLCAS